MAKKLLTLTNYFKNGLVMDLSPTNTPDSCLSNALNATLVTYNGNEFSLLNDMGNGRVETAALPLGYIPVGTCSFGGIIYIVSYNPLENKSLIGCFPSPERNIESDDLSDFLVSLSENEFVELDHGDYGNPTGKVNKYSTKKLLTVNNLNPGDKFVIHWTDNGDTSTNYSTVSNFGNLEKSNDSLVLDWPKLMRIHLVSIEDSGKINYLDSTVQWYNYSRGPFFLKETPPENPGTGVVDIDSYRDSVNGAYSVFLSKVSGKLALLIDLERINTFSASYKITKSRHTNQTSDEFDFFDIYLSTSWDTDNPNVNPIGLILTEHTISQTTPGTNDFEFINPDGTTSDSIYNSNAPSGGDRTRNHVLEYNYTITDTLTPRRNPRDINITAYSDFKNNDYYHTVEGFTDVTSIQPNQNHLHQYIDDGLTHIVHRESDLDNLGNEQQVPADILVNYFNDDVLTYIGTVKIRKTATTSGYTYKGAFSFTVAPCMEYGVLDDLAVSGLIDFSQYNYGIELTHWKYSVSPNALQLTWGLKTALGSDVREITSVVMDFYDFMGHAARFTASNYESYNGQFTEYIALNSGIGNSNITNSENNTKFSHYIPVTEIDSNNLNDYRAIYLHPLEATRTNSQLYGKITRNGHDLYFLYKNPSSINLETKLPQIIELGSFSPLMELRESLVTLTTTLPNEYNYVVTIDDYLNSTSIPTIKYSNYIRAIYNNSTYYNRLKFFKNDAGTLYYGRLYQVIITVNYTEGDQLLSKTYSRWLWNNGIYNDKQHTNDFDILPLPLVLSAQIELDGRDLKELLTVYRPNITGQINASTNYQSLGAQITSIGYENLYTEKLIEYIATGNSSRSVTPDSEGLVTVSELDHIGFSDEYLPNYTRRYRGLGTPNYDKKSIQYAINGNTGLIYLKVKPGFENQANFVFNTNKYNKLTIKVATNNPTISLIKNDSEITPDDLQHLYSDEEKVDKEFIKPVIADSTELNDSTYSTPTKTNLINHLSLITSIGQNDIYDYGAYGQFKDWFSLEVLDKESGTETFQYNDESGEALHVTTGYALLNGVQASSGIGFALKLKGVCYSKTYHYSSVLDNNCKLLKSLLYNLDNWNHYNLAHENNGDSYFYRGLFLKFWYNDMIDPDDDISIFHSKVNVGYQLDEVIYNSINEANGNNFNPSYGNNAWKISEDLTSGECDSDGYTSSHGTFTENGCSNKVAPLTKIMGLINQGVWDYGFIPLTLSGSVYYGENVKIYLPGDINSSTDGLFSDNRQQSVLCVTNGEDSPHSINAHTNASSFVPLLEPVRTNGANYATKDVVGIPVLTISWADPDNKPTRYSDMVASLLGLIYTWDGTMASLVYKYTNTVTLESYQEVWKKDIIVKMAIENNSYEFRKMVALEDITSIYLSLENVLARTLAASNYTTNINYLNVSPFTINNSNDDYAPDATRLVSTQCLAFKYNTGYNVDLLLDLNDGDTLLYDFTNNNAAVRVDTSNTSIELEKCYCLSEDNIVHNLEASNKFYLLSNYKTLDGIVSAQKTSVILLMAPDSDLSRAFVVKRGVARVNPKFLQEVNVDHDSKVHQTRTNGRTTGTIYISNFGMTNKLFNYTNL